MSKYKVLFDGNGSSLIRVVGIGDYVPVAALVEVEAARDSIFAQLCGLLNSDGLQRDLVIETERAIRQRDEYLKTKISTAGHGGSHDTCFPAILREHIKLNAEHLAKLKAQAVRDFVYWGQLKLDPEFSEFVDCAEKFIEEGCPSLPREEL